LDLKRSDNNTDVRPETRALLDRVFNPLCGLSTMIGFVLNSGTDARFMIAGGEMTNVRILQDADRPRRGSYHIGGSGVFRDEPLIKCIGETVERYSQVVAEISQGPDILFESYDRLPQGADRLDTSKFRFFDDQQLTRPGFPFAPFDSSDKCGWMKIRSVLDDTNTWVPAQLLLVGYVLKRHAGEKWISSAMSTGTAAHTNPRLAMRSALLELIQIDSVMGHWYGNGKARRIRLDRRTQAVAAVVERQFAGSAVSPEFYWVANADLPGFAIVCLIRSKPGTVPAVALGIGIDLHIVDAMYKALLEAVGVFQLAKLSLINRDLTDVTRGGIEPASIYNLDDNVCWYAFPENITAIERKFDSRDSVASGDLPGDCGHDPEEDISYLVASFGSTGKQLFSVDLTAVDVQHLGFTSVRVWSPDTLSLCLPSAPQARHPRFAAYGGFQNAGPHPYP
jgi:thiazole/oxazole-forming peptide maturase SagD family component